MCPFCKKLDGKDCAVNEKPSGRLSCACGKHSWPSSGAFLETCRRMSLTTTRMRHDWTQAY